ncbi:MAG TPA: DoxX family protein [Ignavibacteriaceae bacterium]|nr:DoxX family protein [Ignavibacteriaceae bacterium]
MNWTLLIENWADRHHPKWIDYLRILLGIILLLKGIALIINREQVILNMEMSNIDVFSFLVTSQYVLVFYIAGGLLVAIGLLTRIIVLFQIPILIATIIFIDYHKGLFALNSELIYSILILGLLIFYLIYGSGKISVDNLLSKTRKSE